MSIYHITCYCYKCNDSSTDTKSEEPAQEGVTAACHPSKFGRLKDKRIFIEGVGERWIKDTYKKTLSPDRIDVYVGDTDECDCENHPFNGHRKVTFY